MKKIIGLIIIVAVIGVIGLKVGSSVDVSDTVLSGCCHTLRDQPDLRGPGS